MIKKITAAAVLITMLFQFSGCNSDNGNPNTENEYLNQLAFTWRLQQAKIDGTDITRAFNELTLTVKANRSFTVTNPVAPIWPADGTFVLQEASGSANYDIFRSDGTHIHVNDLSATTLSLTLQYQPSGGRASSAGGQYEFFFTK